MIFKASPQFPYFELEFQSYNKVLFIIYWINYALATLLELNRGFMGHEPYFRKITKYWVER
jgi:hypothetical protein